MPQGDVLIHAGDLTEKGGLKALLAFNEWLGTLPYQHKIVIAGNHDKHLASTSVEDIRDNILTNCTYLQDSSAYVEELHIYGSPWTPPIPHMKWAFNQNRGEDIAAKWELIPTDVDILVTHGPCWGYLDMNSRRSCLGCMDLYETVQKIRPKYHIYGHIHEAHGMKEDEGITYINASICSGPLARANNNPIVFEI